MVDIVGYGVRPIWEQAGPTVFAFDGKRKSGTLIIIGLGQAFVRFSQNDGIGTGSGLCFSDSGSPQIDHMTNRAVSVTTGGNEQCNAKQLQIPRRYAAGTEVSRTVPEPSVRQQS